MVRYTGLLSGIALYRVSAAGEDTVLFLNLGSGWQTDADDYSSVIGFVTGWKSCDVSAAGVMVTSGDVVSLGIARIALLAVRQAPPVETGIRARCATTPAQWAFL